MHSECDADDEYFLIQTIFVNIFFLLKKLAVFNYWKISLKLICSLSKCLFI